MAPGQDSTYLSLFFVFIMIVVLYAVFWPVIRCYVADSQREALFNHVIDISASVFYLYLNSHISYKHYGLKYFVSFYLNGSSYTKLTEFNWATMTSPDWKKC